MDMGVYLEHCCIEMHSALVGHQVMLLDDIVEHVHEQGLATAHTAVEIQAWSMQDRARLAVLASIAAAAATAAAMSQSHNQGWSMQEMLILHSLL